MGEGGYDGSSLGDSFTRGFAVGTQAGKSFVETRMIMMDRQDRIDAQDAWQPYQEKLNELDAQRTAMATGQSAKVQEAIKSGDFSKLWSHFEESMQFQNAYNAKRAGVVQSYMGAFAGNKYASDFGKDQLTAIHNEWQVQAQQQGQTLNMASTWFANESAGNRNAAEIAGRHEDVTMQTEAELQGHRISAGATLAAEDKRFELGKQLEVYKAGTAAGQTAQREAVAEADLKEAEAAAAKAGRMTPNKEAEVRLKVLETIDKDPAIQGVILDLSGGKQKELATELGLDPSASLTAIKDAVVERNVQSITGGRAGGGAAQGAAATPARKPVDPVLARAAVVDAKIANYEAQAEGLRLEISGLPERLSTSDGSQQDYEKLTAALVNVRKEKAKAIAAKAKARAETNARRREELLKPAESFE